jgi:hypothetical protein
MLLPRPASLLRWSLAAVLGIQAIALLFDHAVRPLIAVTLAALELAAIVLFLIPRTLIWGAILLIVVLALAAVVHLSLKQTPSVAYLVYAAAIWVVVQDARRSGAIGGGR